MPTTTQILANLTAISNDAVLAAIAWHGAIALALIAIAAGWRPRQRVAGALLAAPLVSAAAFAFAYGNPFNGVVLAAGAATIATIAMRETRERVWSGTFPQKMLGVALVAFAWAYPHFLHASASVEYLYAAPVGLVPCPSLALAIGFALLAGGLDRRIAGALATLGLFYGLVGVVRLGVALDLPLIAGAAALGLLAVRSRHTVTASAAATP